MSNTTYTVATVEQEGVLIGVIKEKGILIGSVAIGNVATVETEEKTVIPSNNMQEVLPSDGKYLSKVIIEPIPENYGLIAYNGYELTVS